MSEEEKPKVEPEVEIENGEKLGDDAEVIEPVDDIEDAEVVEDDAPEELTEEPSDEDQPIALEEKPETPAVAAQPEKPRKGGFFGVVLGGLIAGGIGYGAAWSCLRRDAAGHRLDLNFNGLRGFVSVRGRKAESRTRS